jgi:hypothetical protein
LFYLKHPLTDLPDPQVTNYELGIVIPLATRAEADAAVAWERPARKYGPKDVPWVSSLSFCLISFFLFLSLLAVPTAGSSI